MANPTTNLEVVLFGYSQSIASDYEKEDYILPILQEAGNPRLAESNIKSWLKNFRVFLVTAQKHGAAGDFLMETENEITDELLPKLDGNSQEEVLGAYLGLHAINRVSEYGMSMVGLFAAY